MNASASLGTAKRIPFPVTVHVHSWVSPANDASSGSPPGTTSVLNARQTKRRSVVVDSIAVLALAVGLLALLVVLFLGAFHSNLLAKVRTELSVLKSGVAENDRRWRASLRALQDEVAKVDGRLRETVTPAGPFDTARTLFTLGRYVEAEAAFSRYAAMNKDGRFADAALFYSGLSLMHMRNCGFAVGRFARLLSMFPDSSYAVLAAENVKLCKQAQRTVAGGR